MNGIDPMFLYSDTPSTPMEVAYACILSPATAPGGYSFDGVRQVLAERIPTLVPFRRRLMAVPFGLDHPRWVDDPDFDLDNHLHRAAVPAPYGEAEFRAVVAEIMGHQLSPEQPPWEMHIIEGLAGGKIGLVSKVHHAAIDGVAGAQLLAQLLDLSPEGRAVTETCPPWTPPSLPSNTRLLTDAVPNLLTSPIRSLRALREVGRTAVRIARRAFDAQSGPVSIPLFAPHTFDAPIVPDRTVAFAELGLTDINEIRQRFGVTINDVVLAICSGALRRHLMEHEQQVEGSLVAIVPVSVRAQTEEDLGNRLSAMFISLANDLEHPKERLEAIVSSCAQMKAQEKQVGFGPVASALADALPPALAQSVVRVGTGLGALRRLRAGNLLVSNVPGPDFPLYFSGMRLEAVYPLGPVVDGVALNITVQSYDGTLFVGINASATVVPDVPALAAAMVEELKALRVAAAEVTPDDLGDLAGERQQREAREVHRARPMDRWAMTATRSGPFTPRDLVRTANANASTVEIQRPAPPAAAPRDTSWD
jgi:WS/DGAT/MGAT family acyltransferase